MGILESSSFVLSLEQRVLLHNQYRILARLAESNGEDGQPYKNFAKIVEAGYEGEYFRLTNIFNEEGVPRNVSEEVKDILDMFLSLKRAAEKDGSIRKEDIQFEGFDANNDPHFGISRFLIEDLDLWEEQAGPSGNSHSSATLPRYRAMLRVYKPIWDSHKAASTVPGPLSAEEVKQIVDAGNNPKGRGATP